jgi:hypothetical protein
MEIWTLFGGFDARDRVGAIDVRKCPIYLLIGEYDWSKSPQIRPLHRK